MTLNFHEIARALRRMKIVDRRAYMRRAFTHVGHCRDCGDGVFQFRSTRERVCVGCAKQQYVV